MFYEVTVEGFPKSKHHTTSFQPFLVQQKSWSSSLSRGGFSLDHLLWSEIVCWHLAHNDQCNGDQSTAIMAIMLRVGFLLTTRPGYIFQCWPYKQTDRQTKHRASKAHLPSRCEQTIYTRFGNENTIHHRDRLLMSVGYVYMFTQTVWTIIFKEVQVMICLWPARTNSRQHSVLLFCRKESDKITNCQVTHRHLVEGRWRKERTDITVTRRLNIMNKSHQPRWKTALNADQKLCVIISVSLSILPSHQLSMASSQKRFTGRGNVLSLAWQKEEQVTGWH